MSPSKRPLLFAVLLWLGLLTASLLLRPLLPVSETRYAALAWEMWQHGDWLVPRLNGKPYGDYPPLLFWLIGAAWSLLGVHTWVARLVPALGAIATLALAALLAHRLWPLRPLVIHRTLLLMLGCLYWALSSTLLMSDLLLTACVLLGLLGLLDASERLRGWLLYALALGLGLLSAEPLALLYLVPAGALAPYWWTAYAHPLSWRSWYLKFAAAVLAGGALALAWALPAAWQWSVEHPPTLLTEWGGAGAIDHWLPSHSGWWHLLWLPLLLLPWSLWPPLWRGLAGLRSDRGIRLCVAVIGPALLLFPAVGDQQLQGLLPLFPCAALVAARALEEPKVERWHVWPVAALLMALGLALMLVPWLGRGFPEWVASLSPSWGLLLALTGLALIRLSPATPERQLLALAASALLVLSTLLFGALGPAKPYYDTGPVAQELARLQESGTPLAYVGSYHGQFQFPGRLKQPLTALDADEIDAWIRANPDGLLLLNLRHPTAQQRAAAVFEQPYRGRWLLLLKPDTVDALGIAQNAPLGALQRSRP